MEDFLAQEKGNQGQNYYDRYKDRSRERDSDWRKKNNYRDKGNWYIPHGKKDTKLGMEEMLTKLIKVQENQEINLKKIKANILCLTQKFESHATAIKQLEHQVG